MVCNEIIYIVPTMCLSVMLSWAIMRNTIKFAYKNSLFDRPNSRKIHSKPIPRLGGFSFYITFILCFALLIFCVYGQEGSCLASSLLGKDSIRAIIGGLVGATILFAFGVTDDLTGIRYRTKFLGQLLAAGVLCITGTWINNLHGLFGIYAVSNWEGYLLTCFAVALVTNAFNFIDGIDGLAACLCLVAMTNIFVVGLLYNQGSIVMLSAIVMGSILPFLYFNLLGRPEKHNKTFMGDNGSLFLGFVICFLGIMINNNVHNSSVNPFALAFSPLIIPCFDVLRVVMVRLYKKKSPFVADKSHIHHMLLASNYSQHKVLVVINILAISFTIISYIISFFYNISIVLIAMFLLWIGVMMYINWDYIDKIQKDVT